MCMAWMALMSLLSVGLTIGKVYDAQQRTANPELGLRLEPGVCSTMESMKDMKKAMAVFRISYITMLAEVTV